jgi:hypothetical protein
MVSTKSFPEISNANQTYTYNIRGWLKTLGSSLEVGYKQTNFYESGATVNNWNGNISKITWSGSTGEGKQRTYNFNYDKVNRITAATYSASNEDNWFNLSGMSVSLRPTPSCKTKVYYLGRYSSQFEGSN